MTDWQPFERHHRIINNNAVDFYVGKQLRLRCTFLGQSQAQLGTELHITVRRVQKYERSANRISASRLWDMSQILDVPVSYFFDDMSETTKRSSPRRLARGFDDGTAANGDVKDPMEHREMLELVRAYYTIDRPAVRKCVSDMVKSIATALTVD